MQKSALPTVVSSLLADSNSITKVSLLFRICSAVAYPASGKDFLGQNLRVNEDRCRCCSRASLDSCCWVNVGMGDYWAAGTSLEKSRCGACAVHSAPSCETEPGDCAGGCIRCA